MQIELDCKSHKSNLQDQGLFIEMVIFRCCGFSNFLRPSTTLCLRLQAHISKGQKPIQRQLVEMKCEAKYHHFDEQPLVLEI